MYSFPAIFYVSDSFFVSFSRAAFQTNKRPNSLYLPPSYIFPVTSWLLFVIFLAYYATFMNLFSDQGAGSIGKDPGTEMHPKAAAPIGPASCQSHYTAQNTSVSEFFQAAFQNGSVRPSPHTHHTPGSDIIIPAAACWDSHCSDAQTAPYGCPQYRKHHCS